MFSGRFRSRSSYAWHERTVRPLASFVNNSWVMTPPSSTPPASSLDQDLRPRARTLSWLASLSVAAGELRAAEGYLLELLAWCAFADRDVVEVAGS
jgi:hypothetical protein